jgi:hypothetical protein
MSRPFRTRFALCLLAFTVGLSGCDTIYRPVYSNQKNFYQSPVAYNQKGPAALSAEDVLKSVDTSYTPAAAPDPNAMPPAPAAAPDAMPAAPGAPATPPATPPPPQ